MQRRDIGRSADRFSGHPGKRARHSGRLCPKLLNGQPKYSLNKPAIAETDRTGWYESPSAIVQADRARKLHPGQLKDRFKHQPPLPLPL